MPLDEHHAEQFLASLLRPVQRRPREAVLARHSAMARELRFRRSNGDEALKYLQGRGWTDARFHVLFALNCIYQEILGPLQASSRSGIAGLGTNYPVMHGTQRFDPAYSERVNFLIGDFMAMVAGLNFTRDWLYQNTCGDLIFYIARHEHELDRS
jgi:hypothetical protein